MCSRKRFAWQGELVGFELLHIEGQEEETLHRHRVTRYTKTVFRGSYGR